MIRRLIAALACGSCLIALPAASEQLIREFSGTSPTTTVEFEVEAPWILDWRVTSEFQQFMALEVHLLDGATGFHKGLLVKMRRLDRARTNNGVRMFNESGSFRLQVSSTHAKWNLKVIELTREEAERYTPK